MQFFFAATQNLRTASFPVLPGSLHLKVYFPGLKHFFSLVRTTMNQSPAWPLFTRPSGQAIFWKG